LYLGSPVSHTEHLGQVEADVSIHFVSSSRLPSTRFTFVVIVVVVVATFIVAGMGPFDSHSVGGGGYRVLGW
jgi:hypothetical protein